MEDSHFLVVIGLRNCMYVS